jgi:hypothetical protein
MVRVFGITIPESGFSAGAGSIIMGALRLRTTYMFSQRRVNITDVVDERVAVLTTQIKSDI